MMIRFARTRRARRARSHIGFLAVLGLLGLLGAAACDVTGPGVGPPVSMTPSPIPSGLSVGETITVAVTLRDAETRPVPGIPVSWTPSTGTSVDPAANNTNENGVAFTSWSLGSTAGEHTLVIRAAGFESTVTAITRDEP